MLCAFILSTREACVYTFRRELGAPARAAQQEEVNFEVQYMSSLPGHPYLLVLFLNHHMITPVGVMNAVEK